MAITAETRQDIMELVVAANNAAPGTTLLSELVALSTSGSSLLDIANTLADSASFKATYPTFQTATEFGTEFLGNLVPEASAAAKAEGVTIIEGMLNGGQSRGAVILEAATYLAALPETHSSFGTSAALFNHRVEVATYHTITSEAADSWAIPASVTSSDATVDTGKSAVDTALTPAPVVVDPVTKTLTTGVNNFTGTAADDTFDASTAGSLDTSDTLDGGAGTDNLTATIGAESIRPNISNIEHITFTATGALTVDARDISGMTQLSNESSTNTLTVNNLGVIPAVSINSAGTNNTTLNFTNATLSGSADDLAVTVNNYGAADLILTDTAGTAKLETVTITSQSLASTITNLNTAGVGTTTLNIGGDANLTITNGVNAAITLVDATSASGVVSVSSAAGATVDVTMKGGSGADIITGGAGDDTIHGNAGADTLSGGSGGTDTLEGGAGNDTLSFPGGALTKADTVKGGDGTDAISFSTDESALVDADFTLVTGVETVTAGTNVNIAGTLGDLAAAAGVTTVTFTDTSGNDSIAVDADGPSALTVNFDSDATNANSIAMNASYAGVLTVNADGDELDTRASTITGGKGTSDVLNITADGATASDLSAVTNIETINLVGTTASNTVTLADANATYTSATVYQTLTVDASGLTTGVATLDAALEVDGKVILKGGGAADIITLSSSANFGDTVHGNAGNDTIVVDATADLTAADDIDGGAGTDTVKFSADATVTDAMFTKATNVEAITAAANKDLDITLGDLAAAAGITTVTLTGAAGGDTDTVAIDADGPSAVTVNFDDDTNVVNSVVANASYAGVLTVKADGDEFDTKAHTVTGGKGTSDVLQITADGNAIVTARMANVTNVETVKIAGTTASQSIALNDANATYTSSTSYQTITVDATALTTGVATIDASPEADAKVVVKGGGGADIITASSSSNLGDTIEAGAGNDTINIATASFTSADVIDGGAGTDSISLSNDSSVVDADFTNVTNVETLTAAADKLLIATVDTLAAAAGITKISLTDTGGNDAITVKSGFTNALTVDFDSDASNANSVDASAYTGTLTVTAADDELDTTAATIKGGTGTADEVKITTTAGLDVVLTSGITGVEKITAVGATGGFSITTADGLIASGKNLAFDLTAGDDDAYTINAAAEKDGTVSITADATGAHIITLGQGNDTYTHTGASGVSTVVATKGNNTITTGGGADIITLGTGTDIVTAGAGNDTIVGTGPSVASGVTTSRNFTSADTINGGTGTDILEISTDGFTLVDTDFAGLTSVETLTSTAGARMTSATLGTKAQAAGIATVTLADTTAVDKLVVSADFTNALTVNLDADNTANTVDASASSATVTIVAGDDELDTTASTLKGGSGSSDVLKIATGGNDLVVADSANWSGIETFTTTGNNAFGIALNDGANAAGGSITVNAESLTSTALTLDLSAETDGAYTVKLKGSGNHIITLGQGNDTLQVHDVTTGVITVTGTGGNNTITTAEGNDIITVGSGNDNITSGLGADTIKSTNGALDQNDTVAAGAGTDTIQYTNASTVRDSDFTNVTGVEAITMNGDNAGTFTLGASAAAAGIATITFTDNDTADTLTLGAGFTNNATVVLAADGAANTVDAAKYTKNLTVQAASSELDDNASTITGGTGTSDTLEVAVDASDTLLLNSVSAIETIKTTGTGGGTVTTTATIADAVVASGKSMTFDYTSMDDDALTLDVSAESNGTYTIKTDGTGAMIITLGQGADTYTGTSTGVDTIVATKGANTIKTGDGVDIITLGTGVDTLTVGVTGDGGDADLVKFTATNQLVTNSAIITDWDTAMEIDFDISATLDSGANLILLDDGADASAAGAIWNDITGSTDMGALTANSHGIILSTTTAYTSTDQVETALEYGGGFQLMTGGALSVGDRFLVAWDDNTNSYIGMATTNTAVPDDGYFGSGSLAVVQLVKLSGIATLAGAVIATSDVDLS